MPWGRREHLLLLLDRYTTATIETVKMLRGIPRQDLDRLLYQVGDDRIAIDVYSFLGERWSVFSTTDEHP